ncbi:MAG: hypothetical protein AAF907_01815 [Planctomycetota bacterium]
MISFALLTVSLPALLAAEDVRPLSPAEFQDRFDAFVLLRRDRDLPASATVPAGVRLLRSVDEVRGLRDDRRRAMRRSLLSKLTETRDDLIRQGMRWERDRRRGRLSAASRRRGDTSLAGGGQLQNARQLINLIQSVIAPETWDVNGGPSTISYFEMYQIMVVRAPQQVQEEIGGLLGGLRK